MQGLTVKFKHANSETIEMVQVNLYKLYNTLFLLNFTHSNYVNNKSGS